MARRRMNTVVLAVVAAGLVAGACGDDDGAETVTVDVVDSDAAGEGVEGDATTSALDSPGDDQETTDETDMAAAATTTVVAGSEMTTFPPPAPVEPYEVEPVDCSAWAPETAEAGICDSFSRWVRADTPDADRVQMMEGGEARADTIISGFAEFRSSVEFATVRVQRVTVLTDALAEVEFDVRWMDGPSPFFPTTILGYAVFETPRWRVSAFTTCAMALAFGTDCSGLDPPAPPTGEEPLG